MIDIKLHFDNTYVIGLGKDQFVGIDQSSGGYPYSTTYSFAGKFQSVAEAVKYIGSGITQYLNGNPVEPRIMKVEYISFVDCSDEVVKLSSYEKELALLNQKYGVK